MQTFLVTSAILAGVVGCTVSAAPLLEKPGFDTTSPGDGAHATDAGSSTSPGPGTAPAPASDAGAGTDASTPSPVAMSVICSKLLVTGDPTSAQGASWTYQATDDEVPYDLNGTLLSPAGPGPFAAVLVSHGLNGSAVGAAKNTGSVMRTWGLVAIATNYTHSATPAGLPAGDVAASTANILRAHKTRQLLGCLPNVDGTRVAAHGHSMGALLTGTLVGTYAGEFKVASHTAGGVSDTGTVNNGVATTTAAAAAAIKVPYQMHHGDKDTVVPLALDQRLDQILTGAGIAHELQVYPNYDHNQMSGDATMFQRVRAWYTAHGLL
jgi:dienelactone hydrolase